MSSTYAAALERLTQGLDELAQIDPTYRTVPEKTDALVGLSRLIARAQAEQLRILAASDDIAEATGARSTAAWLADASREAHGTVRRSLGLARRLESEWTQVGAALGTGAVNLAQARVIVESLDALPETSDHGLRDKAERHLVNEAARFGPRELRVLGERVLEHLAPEIAEEAEYQRLLRQEQNAEAVTRLDLRRRGDGTTDLHGRLPDSLANRLRVYLDAFASPRKASPGIVDEVANLPMTRQRGIAFGQLLENILGSELPRHGGTATTVMVTLDHETLTRQTGGVATTSTGDRITADDARRLACQAGIIPVVLGGRSEIMDLGRRRRLIPEAIRRALNLRDGGCTEVGCTMPAAFCEAHHVVPWSRGGATSLENSKLLCSFHHHRARDSRWKTTHRPNGATSFHRRT